MSNDACDYYNTTGTVWPKRKIPATAFHRGSPARDIDAAKAWAFFEMVESYDAQIRVQYAGTDWSSNKIPWYQFKNSSENVLYRRGQILHTELCPKYDWISQRILGVPSTGPLTNVFPGICPNYKAPITDPFALFVGTRITNTRDSSSYEYVSPAFSATKGSIKEIDSIEASTNVSSNNSSQKGSRRASFSQ
jgi:hypothetical protein